MDIRAPNTGCGMSGSELSSFFFPLFPQRQQAYRADSVGEHATNHGLSLDKMMQSNGADAGLDRGIGRGFDFDLSKYWNRMIDHPQMRPFSLPMCPKDNPLVNSFPGFS